MRGLISCTRSQPKPRRSSTPGPKFSITTSHSLRSPVNTSFPSGFLRFTVMERLLQLSIVK